MSRLIFLFAIAALIYLVLKSFRPKAQAKSPVLAEDMVCCAHCGVHLPKGESVIEGDRNFCSESHRDARPGVKRQP